MACKRESRRVACGSIGRSSRRCRSGCGGGSIARARPRGHVRQHRARREPPDKETPTASASFASTQGRLHGSLDIVGHLAVRVGDLMETGSTRGKDRAPLADRGVALAGESRVVGVVVESRMRCGPGGRAADDGAVYRPERLRETAFRRHKRSRWSRSGCTCRRRASRPACWCLDSLAPRPGPPGWRWPAASCWYWRSGRSPSTSPVVASYWFRVRKPSASFDHVRLPSES